MSIYIGNGLEDRLKASEIENASLKKYSEYHQVVHEIDHMSDLHLDSSFYKLQSMKIDNYHKSKEWYDSSIGQLTVNQQLDKKRPKLSNPNQMQNKKRYVNFENGSHFICSFNLNNPESTVFIAFKMTDIASGNFILLNGIIDNSNDRNESKSIAFYKTHSGLGLIISPAYGRGSYMAVANNNSTLILPDYKFPSSKSNCTILNKWHVISVRWSNRNNLSNIWSYGEKLMTFNTRNVKGSDHCYIGDVGIVPGNTYLTGCIGEIIGFYRSLTDTETWYIHPFTNI